MCANPLCTCQWSLSPLLVPELRCPGALCLSLIPKKNNDHHMSISDMECGDNMKQDSKLEVQNSMKTNLTVHGNIVKLPTSKTYTYTAHISFNY